MDVFMGTGWGWCGVGMIWEIINQTHHLELFIKITVDRMYQVEVSYIKYTLEEGTRWANNTLTI